jgi:phosphotransferase system  glucose/maltose/N-acetylglucosamine-specific IIC component
VGFGVAAIAFVLYGFLGRRAWALYAGSVFQLLVIATGVWVPMMYVLGVIFALLWFTGIWLARKVEREQRAREEAATRAGPAQASEAPTQAG